MKTSSLVIPILMVALSLVFLSCNQSHTKSSDDIGKAAWSLDAMKNATYSGFSVYNGPVKLLDGRWEGAPYAEGGASRPSVHFVDDFYRTGMVADRNVAAIFVAESTGGSGTFLYLAVVDKKDGAFVNTSTAPVGDRVQVRDARFENGTILVDVLQAGPGDAACCPGELVTRRWRLENDHLVELETAGQARRLSIDIIAATKWRLSRWKFEDEAPAEPTITLVYENGQFAGNAGCNRYFAPVEAGDNLGELKIGPAGTTRIICPENIMAAEARFLKQLNGINKFGFMAGRLALSFSVGDEQGFMSFEQEVENSQK